MEQDDAIELTKQLIDKARKNVHETPSLICNFSQFLVARDFKRGLKGVIKSFKDTAKLMYKNYTANLKNNIDDNGHLLFQYRIMKHCQEFYETEQILVSNAITDYINYIFCGHIIDTILGIPRQGDEDDRDKF